MSSLTTHHLWPSYFLEAKYEFLRLLRTPAFAVPALVFTPMFYLLFGVMLSSKGGIASYLLWTYAVFGVAGHGLFSFGVVVALEREQGFLRYKRALPMPPGAYLFAKMAMAMLFSLITLCVLALLATLAGGVSMPLSHWGLFFGLNMLGAVPFSAIGLWIGSWVGGQGAPAVVNMIYLPMAFLSGLMLPVNVLPKMLQTLAPIWPSFHLSQLGLKVIGRDAGGSALVHIGVLVVFSVVFAVLAKQRLARN
jgi:ABC-2 type transport system permease protein